MMFWTREAKETAIENISKQYVKLASTPPTDHLTLQDIESILFYLRTMKEELEHEIRKEDRKELERKKEEQRKNSN